MQHIASLSYGSFSSLYIGILAATGIRRRARLFRHVVSVPFTSGSSLQPTRPIGPVRSVNMFQFPLHRDPRCNEFTGHTTDYFIEFQFPLHRDPRCNLMRTRPLQRPIVFQFPLHRDPRCNCCGSGASGITASVSVPFTSGSSLQLTAARSFMLWK